MRPKDRSTSHITKEDTSEAEYRYLVHMSTSESF